MHIRSRPTVSLTAPSAIAENYLRLLLTHIYHYNENHVGYFKHLLYLKFITLFSLLEINIGDHIYYFVSSK